LDNLYFIAFLIIIIGVYKRIERSRRREDIINKVNDFKKSRTKKQLEINLMLGQIIEKQRYYEKIDQYPDHDPEEVEKQIEDFYKMYLKEFSKFQ